jgi:predicted dehydrogenase
MKTQISRRQFLNNSAAAAGGAAIGTHFATAKSYARVAGANDRINWAVIGTGGRGGALIDCLADCENVEISHVCDADLNALEKGVQRVEKKVGKKPQREQDVRKLLESKDIDAVAVATPDHWHTCMALMGLQAGKHVYVEKPCSHNPREGELLLEATKWHKTLVQMGNQQRSSDHTIALINKIRDGVIGKPYLAKAWYSRARSSIGTGKIVPVPNYFDWDLWQGPAPRRAFKDNIHPYNWHWIWHWGTGETLNNGTHEIDVCRWALGVDGYPNIVNTTGGRYHYQDDWEFYDTITAGFQYDDASIVWGGESCQAKKTLNRGRGSMIYGTRGSAMVDRNGYILYDEKDNVVQEVKSAVQLDVMDTAGGDVMVTEHLTNFLNAIRKGGTLNSPIEDANVSVTTIHLANIAWKVGRSLNLNPVDGHILGDGEAMQMWGREYEPGWEPKV